MKGVVVVTSKCLACKSCELACAVEHSQSGNIYDAIREEPLPEPRVSVESFEGSAVPLQCRHCEDAPCVEICPTGALRKSESGQVVVFDKERCIGCKWCVVVCPFGVIWLGEDGRSLIKCDLCPERVNSGKEPACVDACPTGALIFVEVDEVVRGRRSVFARHLQTSEEIRGVTANGGVGPE